MGGGIKWPMQRHCIFLQFLIFILTQCVESSLLHSRRPSVTSSKQCDRPCLNNGRCVDGMCLCPPGWTGPQCESCFNRILKNSTSNGFITDGPLNYSASSRCTWVIESSAKGALVLKLEDFFTECCWDHLYVYDGKSVDDNLIAALSGNLTGIELVAKTGTAIVFFTSDLAFNLRGFNVSYTYGNCPYNCNNHGTCTNDGNCQCNPGFAGEFCETQHCTADMIDKTGPCNRGNCQKGDKCLCPTYAHGDLCQSLTTEPAWDRVPLSSDDLQIFHPRASHQAVNVDDKIWLYGGYQLNQNGSCDLLTFDPKKSKFNKVTVNQALQPVTRYDHSMVQWKDALFVFGGVFNQSFITNELWSFNLTTLQWSLESAQNWSALAIPSAVAGHTAHVIKDEMYVVFGYNPFEGYIHRVQIYSFTSKTWSNPDEKGGTDSQVIGRFGHASVLTYQEDKKPLIFVYGGFNAPLNSYSYAITDDLLMYDPIADTWTTLESPGMPRFRHSAVVIDGIMVIFGGNSHNESTAQQIGCYSSHLLAYDTICNKWMKISVDDINQISRYGHAAVVAPDEDKSKLKMFIFGGFSGVARHDVLKLTMTSECNSEAYNPKECSEDANGIRCHLNGKKCEPALANLSYKQSFTEFIKSDSPKLQTGCYSSSSDVRLIEESSCADVKDCFDCVSRKRCGWCTTTQKCMLGTSSSCLDDLTSDRKSCNSIAKKGEKTVPERACGLATNCYSCRRLSHCVWLAIETKRVCVSKSDHALILEQHNRRQAERLHYDDLRSNRQGHVSLLDETLPKNALNGSPLSSNWNHYRDLHSNFGSMSIYNSTAEQCPDTCATYNKCFDCVRAQCMWCPTIKRCVPMDTYMISFPYGQCQTWVTAANSPHACEMDPLDCKLQKTCTECQLVGPQCGWCDKGSNTGLGECMAASLDHPKNKSQCSAERHETWYYVGEPACQCNGHSNCTTEYQPSTQNTGYPTLKCRECANMTTGDNCETCMQGYYGDARNGGTCTQCNCNNQATSCDPESGYCFCNIKGTAGRHCETCELKYVGDPKEGKPCTFELVIDFVFTFRLDADDFKDKYVKQINFFSMPFKKDTDVQFSVTCESESNAKVSINLTSNVFDPHPGMHNRLSPALPCTPTGIKRVYSASDFDFGLDSNTTFYVKITDFETPIKIQISFSQSPPINWILFFVIFAACFIVLLVVAGILLLIKQRIRNAGHEANVQIENERMAKRPKALVKVDFPTVKQNTQPTAVSVEPCRSFSTAIYTVIVRLPTGNKNFTPYGTSGLAFASTLCHLPQAQIALLEPPNPNEKTQNQKSNLKRFIPRLIRR